MNRRDETVNPDRYNYFVCPNCGGEVRIGAPGCPHCGSDDKTGWKEDAHDVQAYGGYAGDPDFDYDEFVRKEFGGGDSNGNRISPKKLLITIAVSLIAIAFIFMLFTL